jgi:hypothetical protein
MKYFILSLLLVSSIASADFTFIVPQKPGDGTSQWANIVVREMQKYMDEKITIKHIPGARDIPGFDAFHEEYMQDDTYVMISHGGNGVSFLQEEVKYDYAAYDSIGLMNLNIIVGRLKDTDLNPVKFAAGSGMVPEAYAMTMLICGPNKTLEQYVRCFNDNVIWVKGMSGGERRLAFKRGELNVTRENPASYKKHVEPSAEAKIWFHHGILQEDGSHKDDPNYLGYQFEVLFKEKWGVVPSGQLYDAYKLVKSFRDGLQKAIWVRAGNPNAALLREALHKVATNQESIDAIKKAVGQYEWVIGDAGNSRRDLLMTFISKDAMETLVYFNREALGLASVNKL